LHNGTLLELVVEYHFRRLFATEGIRLVHDEGEIAEGFPRGLFCKDGMVELSVFEHFCPNPATVDTASEVFDELSVNVGDEYMTGLGGINFNDCLSGSRKAAQKGGDEKQSDFFHCFAGRRIKVVVYLTRIAGGMQEGFFVTPAFSVTPVKTGD
jgi:hypothetical protein